MGTAGGVALAATNAAPGHHPLAIVTQTYCRRWMSSGQPGTMHRILARFFVVMDERSVGRILKTLTFSHISVRPRHPQADAEAQETHKKTLPISSPPSFPMPRKASRSSYGGRTRPASANKAA